MRHRRLALAWLPHWKDAGAYGLPGRKPADVFAYETCLKMHDAAAAGHHAAVLSYDLKKCFDAIPIRLALAVMQHRDADVPTLRALQGFYSQRCRLFKLDGCYTAKFIARNGILQGCPLSMMILTSVATAWLERVLTEHPTASPKACADDLSVWSHSHVCRRLRH